MGGVSPVREVVARRIHCPGCDSEDWIVTRTCPRDGWDDELRYCRCRTCGEPFKLRLTDDPEETGPIPDSGIPADDER